MKTDVVHSALVGAVFGICLAALVLVVTVPFGWYQTVAGNVPFIYLAIILLGFCTWLGGFRGIQTTNSRIRSFDEVARNGVHVLFVDQPGRQAAVLEDVVRRYPSIEAAGEGRAAPRWLVSSQHNLKRFFSETFP